MIRFGVREFLLVYADDFHLYNLIRTPTKTSQEYIRLLENFHMLAKVL